MPKALSVGGRSHSKCSIKGGGVPAIIHSIINVPRAPRGVLQLLQEHTLSRPHSRDILGLVFLRKLRTGGPGGRCLAQRAGDGVEAVSRVASLLVQAVSLPWGHLGKPFKTNKFVPPRGSVRESKAALICGLREQAGHSGSWVLLSA